MPPTMNGMIMCQRRSPVLSEWRQTRIIETTAQALGIAVSKPTCSSDTTPVDLITEGVQNARPDRLDTVQQISAIWSTRRP